MWRQVGGGLVPTFVKVGHLRVESETRSDPLLIETLARPGGDKDLV